jgi:hypothetical protein
MSMTGEIENVKLEVSKLSLKLLREDLTDKERRTYECELAYTQKRLQDLYKSVEKAYS